MRFKKDACIDGCSIGWTKYVIRHESDETPKSYTTPIATKLSGSGLGFYVNVHIDKETLEFSSVCLIVNNFFPKPVKGITGSIVNPFSKSIHWTVEDFKKIAPQTFDEIENNEDYYPGIHIAETVNRILKKRKE